MTIADERRAEVTRRLDGKTIVWFGTRGLDARPLLSLGLPVAVFSQIAPLPEDKQAGVEEVCLEQLSSQRRDLDRYDIDFDIAEAAINFRAAVQAKLDMQSLVLCAYRPMGLLAPYFFCRQDIVAASPFHLSQRPFEHKPWVEQQLRAFDPTLPILQWTFVRDDDLETIARLLKNGPLAGRTATGAGGVGVFAFSDVAEFLKLRPPHPDGFLAVSRYLKDAAPLNVNGVVYANGEVRSFGLSYQLIGIQGLTRRKFGFSGNDFGAAAKLPAAVHRESQRLTERTGKWLASFGYRGIFGLDLLWDGGTVWLTEVNARFQASTALNAQILQSAGLPDPFLENIAAFLGVPPPPVLGPTDLSEIATTRFGQGPVAQIIFRNIDRAPRYFIANASAAKPSGHLDAVPERYVAVEPEAMAFRAMSYVPVTDDGYRLTADAMTWKDAVYPRI